MNDVSAAQQTTSARAFAAQRANMVDSQIRPSDITDRRIIRAMGLVPREAFVPPLLQSVAYVDNALAMVSGTAGRKLMAPRVFAKLVQAAEIPDGGRVLEIGTGTGYGLAVLGAMGLKAFGLECDAALAEAAKAAGLAVTVGALEAGLAAESPFDAIILAGSTAKVPTGLFDQLKSGGRLVAICGESSNTRAMVWLRTGPTIASRDAFDAVAPALPIPMPPRAFAL